MPDRNARLAALLQIFDEEVALDIDAAVIHRDAGRTFGLLDLVQEFRNAGLATQADELLRRINEQSPRAVPTFPALPQPTQNGSPASVPLQPARRGRPPKTGGSSS